MLAQFKYAARTGRAQRGAALLAVIGLNLAFILLWKLGASPLPMRILGVVFSSLAFTALLVVQVIGVGASVKGVFRAPRGYLFMLAPVSGKAILAGRVLAAVILDALGFLVGVIGILWQAFLLAGLEVLVTAFRWDIVFWGAVLFVLYYSIFILAIFFAKALSASVFYRFRARGFLGLLAAAATLGVMSYGYALIGFFIGFSRIGPLFTVQINMGLNAGMLGFIIVSLAQAAVLFFLTSGAIERKINL